jgi:nicotinate-nucleotide adenylyltransferase
MVDGALRLRMVELAVEDNPRFEASSMELERGGISYTVETLRELRAAREGAEITLIIGSDSYNDISTWRDCEEIFTLADVAVVGRPGEATKKLADTLPVEVAGKFWYDENLKGYASSYGGTVYFPATTMLDISSTRVREMISGGASIRYLVPDAVARFITDERLYGPGT